MNAKFSLSFLGGLVLAGGASLALAGPLTGVTAISAGDSHTCAIVAGGAVTCWGWNLSGQLGDGTTTTRAEPATVPGLAASEVDAGSAHTCALSAGGGVKCWGNNITGQVGDGTTVDRASPVDVVGLGSGVAEISAGHLNTCTVTSAGGLKCWGDNVMNQLGGYPAGSSNTPVDAAGLTSGMVAVASATQRSCALTAAGGVKCWGSWPNVPGAVDEPGLASGVAAIALSNSHRCALTTAGGVKCWGNNFQGELGNGTTTSSYDGVVDVSGLASGVAAISVGGGHSCALTVGGAVKCWGGNWAGQIGDGTTTNRLVPVDVPGLGSGVVAISAGGSHTCALLQGGEARCWGWNESGQLARGTAGGIESLPVVVGTFAPQAITFGSLPGRNVDDPAFTVSASASSGLAVRFSSLTPSVCTVSGTTVTFVAVGICSVGADQSGDAVHARAPQVARHFLVSGALAGAPPRLVNISARCGVHPVTHPLIAGVVLGPGQTVSELKTALFRARGPSLGAFGVTNPLADPYVRLYAGQALYNENRDWEDPVVPWWAALPPETIAELGVAPPDDLESAILKGLIGGSYTAVVDATQGNVSGVALVEVFEIDNPGMEIMNLSARGWVGTGGDVMIAGFVIEGDSPMQVMVRARGPSLVPHGIADALDNPLLQLIRSSDQVQLDVNDNWQAAVNVAAVTASGYAPDHPLDAAILITLSPGAYTAIMSPVASTATGVGIVEVFALP